MTIHPAEIGSTDELGWASTSGNALLNRLYCLLESETRITCEATGLDAGIGILHADTPARDSLALDLMEAARPTVDRWLLAWVADHTFNRRDFYETGDGVIRLTRPLTQHLSAILPALRTAIAPVAEFTAQSLSNTHVPIPLTESNRRKRFGTLPRYQLEFSGPNVCRTCGAFLSDSRRNYCDDECRRVWNAAQPKKHTGRAKYRNRLD